MYFREGFRENFGFYLLIYNWAFLQFLTSLSSIFCLGLPSAVGIEIIFQQQSDHSDILYSRSYSFHQRGKGKTTQSLFYMEAVYLFTIEKINLSITWVRLSCDCDKHQYQVAKFIKDIGKYSIQYFIRKLSRNTLNSLGLA